MSARGRAAAIAWILGLRSALRSRSGQAVLPCYLADGDDALERRTDPVPELETDFWLLVHPDLRRVARVRAIRDFLVDACARPAIQARLAGTPARG